MQPWALIYVFMYTLDMNYKCSNTQQENSLKAQIIRQK